MPQRIRVESDATATVRPSGKYFVSHCPVLDVYSQGHTEEEALRNLRDALRLFVESCHERGTLDQVLKECGFELDTGAPAPVEDEGAPAADPSAIRVPVSFVAP